ncbi:hypothetical protein [Halalkalibacter urbisdiaboli]|nr:hypothetical protein [Halalkalibacter urbisdiaboli]
MNKKHENKQPTASQKEEIREGKTMVDGYAGDKKLAGPNRPAE